MKANEQKHTPGPWHVLMRDNYMRLFMPRNSIGLTGDVARGYVGQANARLIAAAPDLLEACEALLQWEDTTGNYVYTELDVIIQKAMAAVAKATGKEADTCNRCGTIPR